MKKALCALVGLFAVMGAAPVELPVPHYLIEVMLHQGPKKADGSSLISHPTLGLLERQSGHVTVGQIVSEGFEKPRSIGPRFEATVRPGNAGPILSMVMERSEMVNEPASDLLIGTVRTEFERAIPLGKKFVVKPAKTGKKDLWAEIRVDRVKD